MKKRMVPLGLLLLLLVAAQARADSALDTVKSRVNQVLGVLGDPALKADSAKPAKVKQLRAIFDKTFDFVELSRATLSRNWDKLKPEQQKDFVVLYRAILEKVYVDMLLLYKDQQVVFGRERALGENRVEVDIKVVSGSTETPIQFRLVSKSAEWWVYDFVVENISVVSSYRSQFGRLLTKESPEEMLDALRKQVGGF